MINFPVLHLHLFLSRKDTGVMQILPSTNVSSRSLLSAGVCLIYVKTDNSSLSAVIQLDYRCICACWLFFFFWYSKYLLDAVNPKSRNLKDVLSLVPNDIGRLHSIKLKCRVVSFRNFSQLAFQYSLRQVTDAIFVANQIIQWNSDWNQRTQESKEYLWGYLFFFISNLAFFSQHKEMVDCLKGGDDIYACTPVCKYICVYICARARTHGECINHGVLNICQHVRMYIRTSAHKHVQHIYACPHARPHTHAHTHIQYTRLRSKPAVYRDAACLEPEDHPFERLVEVNMPR